MRPLDGGWHEVDAPAGPGEPYLVRPGERPGGARPGLAPPGGDRARPVAGRRPAAPTTGATTQWRGRPWHEAVLYELHVGTFTPEGTFAGARARLAYLARARRHRGRADADRRLVRARATGATTACCPTRPTRPTAGPTTSRRWSTRRTRRGLMVFLDVVYNHFGPEGNYSRLRAAVLHRRAQDALGRGDRLPAQRAGARLLHRQRALLARGVPLRRAAVRRRARDQGPLAHPHPGRAGRARCARAWTGAPSAPRARERAPTRPASCAATRPSGRLYDAQWNDDAHHVLHVLLTGEDDGYYADYAGEPARQLARCARRRASPTRASRRRTRRQAARRALGQPAALGLRRLPPEPRPDRQPGAGRAAGRAGRAQGARRRRRRSSCSRHTCRCCSWARSGARRPVPVLLRLPRRARRRRCARAGAREFAGFFANPKAAVPDPLAETTFTRSKLDWGEKDRAPHDRWLARSRVLLRLRAEQLAPGSPPAGAGRKGPRRWGRARCGPPGGSATAAG